MQVSSLSVLLVRHSCLRVWDHRTLLPPILLQRRTALRLQKTDLKTFCCCFLTELSRLHRTQSHVMSSLDPRINHNFLPQWPQLISEAVQTKEVGKGRMHQGNRPFRNNSSTREGEFNVSQGMLSVWPGLCQHAPAGGWNGSSVWRGDDGSGELNSHVGYRQAWGKIVHLATHGVISRSLGSVAVMIMHRLFVIRGLGLDPIS